MLRSTLWVFVHGAYIDVTKIMFEHHTAFLKGSVNVTTTGNINLQETTPLI